MNWQLIFSATGSDCSSIQIYETTEDPQESAIEIISRNPGYKMIAAVDDDANIYPAVDERRAECELDGWPIYSYTHAIKSR